MKSTILLIMLSALGLATISPRAGQLSAELDQLVVRGPADEMVSIWIKLQSDRSAASPKATAAGATTRPERYRLVTNDLKMRHQTAQRDLIQSLRQLQSRGKSSQVRGHWLVNIVEAEIAVSELVRLASRPDVVSIHQVPQLSLISPGRYDTSSRLSSGTATVGDNVQFVNADDAWAMGYTGEGRIICSFDTGVDGDHPALSASWKGNDGNQAAAWFFPRAGEGSTPRSVPDCGFSSCNTMHGTHTMGTMLGHDDTGGDTVGVAPGAQWISAAVIDIAGVSIIDAFEWAADPDGDPNTIADVPDVINHSWGVEGIGCEEIFFDMIDATEALGIVNIFAAGNDGSSNDITAAATIRNPANRALDSLDCFAVGNVEIIGGIDVTLFSTSSQGPSDCNGAIKPNVTAPGTLIRSSIPGGSYFTASGTSMAAPHVSGLVTLLRQKNPDASVDQIKEAILTTARDFGKGTPNNKYGWGVIDFVAALNAMPSAPGTPSLRVYNFLHDPISPGDTVTGTLAVQNLGGAATAASASLTGSDPSLTVLNGSTTIGNIGIDETRTGNELIRVVVSDTVTVGTVLSLDLQLQALGYTAATKLHFPIEPRNSRSFVTHDVGRVDFTVSNFGTYGMGPGAYFNAGGAGFLLDDGDNFLYESGLMVAVDPDHVSDGLRNSSGEPDGDFAVTPGGSIILWQPGSHATQHTYCRFDDSRGLNPIGVEIEQETYAWANHPYDNFSIIRYIITNTNAYQLSNLFVGLYLDWDCQAYAQNAGGYENSEDFAWIAYNPGFGIFHYRGVKLLDGTLATPYTGLGAMAYYPSVSNPTADGLTEEEKYWAAVDGMTSADTYKTSSEDLLQLMTAGPLVLAAGAIDTIAFAVLGGDDFEDIVASSDNSEEVYRDSIPTGVYVRNLGELPTAYALHQNYPNPFNPSTVIAFDMPRAGDFELTIYNVLGQQVHQLAGHVSAGQVELEWDATEVSSGVYFYRLVTSSWTETRKMLLLK